MLSPRERDSAEKLILANTLNEFSAGDSRIIVQGTVAAMWQVGTAG